MHTPHKIDKSRLHVIEAIAAEAAGASRAASEKLRQLQEKRDRIEAQILEIETAPVRIAQVESKLPALRSDLSEMQRMIEEGKVDSDLARGRRSSTGTLLQSCKTFLEGVR